MSGSVILALLIKSSLTAGAGLGLSRALPWRPAERVDILRATLAALALIALWTLAGPALKLALLPAASPAPVDTTLLWDGAVQPVAGLTVSGRILAPDVTTWLALAWGVLALGLIGRFAVGTLTLARWTREASLVTDGRWLGRLAAETHRPILKESHRVAGPLSWGMKPGVVLIDPATRARPEQASAVLAHEIAHLKRGDWIALAASQLMLAVFWFSPLVWWVHRELQERSEEAADAAAVVRIDPETYARALIGHARAPDRLPALAMAATPKSLKRRIAVIMKTAPKPRRLAVAASIVALVAVATPLAALEVTRRLPDAPPAPPAPPSIEAPPAPTPPLPAQNEIAPPAPVAPAAPPAPTAPPAPPTATTWSQDDGVWIMRREDLTPEQRADIDAARAEAEAAQETARHAREQARDARILADHQRSRSAATRDEARQARAQAMAGARLAAEQVRLAAEQGRLAAEQGRLAAERGRAQAEVARRDAARAMASARVSMRQGAEQMHRGASRMREEARRLEDPAYRARQIERNRERGHTVTDGELQALSPRLRSQADELDRNADEMAGRASEG